MTYGYRYSGVQTGSEEGINLLDLGKAVLKGTVEGGELSAAFYGAGKVVEKLHNSIPDAQKSDSESNFI